MRLKRSAEFAGVVGKAAKLGHRMYETAFGLHRHPFQASDSRRPFYVSSCVRNLIPQVLHALRTDLGVAVLTGPAGSGKTAFLRHLKSLLSTETRILQCSAAAMESVPSLWDLIGSAPTVPRGASGVSGVSSPTTPLLSLAGTRWNVVERLKKSAELWGPLLLLIDDAHLLPVAVLHELRALLEEPAANGHLIRCLIAGPLNLEEEFTRPSHADFSGMIRCHVFLHPLASVEAAEYLETQIRSVGGETRTLFTRDALELIVSAAEGLPRCINLLADESFVVGFESGSSKIDSACVATALERLRHLPYSWNVSVTTPEVTPGLPSFQTGTVFSTDGNTAVVEIGGAFEPLPSMQAPSFSIEVAPSEDFTSFSHVHVPLESTAESIEVAEFDDVSQSAEVSEPPDLSQSPEALQFDEVHSQFDEVHCDDALFERTVEDWPDIDDVPESTHGEGFMVPSPAETVAELGHLEGTNRLPVFDRYTWIELNREVPSGHHTLVSARQRRLSEIDQLSAATVISRPQTSSIPIERVSEQEMTGWLARRASGSDHLETPATTAAPVTVAPVAAAVEAPVDLPDKGHRSIADVATEPTKSYEQSLGQDQSDEDEQFFFSLPIPIDSTINARRTGIVETDGVLPLATSIASLQQEVRTFNRVSQAENGSAGSRSDASLPITANQPQPYVVGSLLREAMSRIEPVEEPVEMPVALETRPVSADRTTRFSNLFSSLRTSRKSDDR